MLTITREELLALDGAPDATHAVFRNDGSLYFCASLVLPDEYMTHEEEYWRGQGMTMKEVTLT